ncbi:RagB/SusD family nutrient uptake outer membrane protein [Siphonobacter sp.]|uniref:RagB/SusD family nutrient uptake outer membrane protein n=1 Tax=Siphonobacter sp. TaxID=1869184 RepID=UPI003B3AF465
MKKTRFSYILLAAITLTVSSCGDKLNIAPTQSIDQDVALTTSKDVEAALIGAYDALGEYYVWGGQLQMSSDLLAATNELKWLGTFVDPGQFYDKKILTNNLYGSNIWLNSYETINICNNVLANIDKVDAAKKNRIQGEALFIRGSVYFELVRLFAKTWGDGDNTVNPGVPLVLTPTTEINNGSYVSRNSVAQVYAKVLEDLLAAESLLPDAASTSTSGKMTGQATKWAAASILSRVYLMQQNYAAARDAANRVIQSNKYALNQNYAASFNLVNMNSAENIFSTQVTSQDGDNSLRTFYSIDSRGDIYITANHINEYEQGDERADLFYQDGDDFFTEKFSTIYSNVPVIRLAEMYLTRAEANFRLNTSVGATPVADVNLIRNRVNLPSLTSTSLTLSAILKERKLELMFEGHLLHDLKRTRRSVGAISFNANNLVYPIPQRETDVNSQLVQNPGYN